MSGNKKRMELSLNGRVQGVGFRHFTVRTVEKLGEITGWVKNEPDGSVTLIAEGPKKKLKKLYEAVEDGPRRAQVDSISGDMDNSTGEFTSFDVRY